MSRIPTTGVPHGGNPDRHKTCAAATLQNSAGSPRAWNWEALLLKPQRKRETSTGNSKGQGTANPTAVLSQRKYCEQLRNFFHRSHTSQPHDGLQGQPPCQYSCPAANWETVASPNSGGRQQGCMLFCRFLSALFHNKIFPELCNKQIETETS